MGVFMGMETYELSVNGDVLEWQNHEFMITVNEAEEIADEVRKAIREESIDGVIVDNRSADGAWLSEVTDVWSELMRDLYNDDVYCATVSATATNSMQINQLSESEGTDDRIKAFTDYQDAVNFVNTET